MNNEKRLHRKARAANLIANSANFLVNWRPFDRKVVRKMYNWAHKVRSNDPAWTEYLTNQQESESGPTPEAA